MPIHKLTSLSTVDQYKAKLDSMSVNKEVERSKNSVFTEYKGADGKFLGSIAEKGSITSVNVGGKSYTDLDGDCQIDEISEISRNVDGSGNILRQTPKLEGSLNEQFRSISNENNGSALAD